MYEVIKVNQDDYTDKVIGRFSTFQKALSRMYYMQSRYRVKWVSFEIRNTETNERYFD